MNESKNVYNSFFTLHQNNFIALVLHGNNFHGMKNRSILISTTIFTKDLQRIDDELQIMSI